MDSENGHYKVIVSNRATQMLVSHVGFLAKTSEQAAVKLADSFVEAASSLDGMPLRNPLLRAEYIPQNKYRKLLFADRYLLIYQVVDDTVYVDYVIDCRQDYQWLIR